MNEKPLVAFVLSLIVGFSILQRNVPGLFFLQSQNVLWLAIIFSEIPCGIMILIGAVLLYFYPNRIRYGGILVLVFTIISFAIYGIIAIIDFAIYGSMNTVLLTILLGRAVWELLLGIIGGVTTIKWKPKT